MVAVLKPECVEQYEAIHRDMTDQDYAQMHDVGISTLRIYRIGLTLIMVLRTDGRPATLEPIGTRARANYDLCEACFAQTWRAADPVFSLPDARGKA